MAIYNVNSDIKNFLTRGFVSSKYDLDAFTTIQDPTFLSFKVEFFFPTYVNNPSDSASVAEYMQSDGFLTHNFSQEGLLLPPQHVSNPASSASLTSPNFVAAFDPGQYQFADSAEDYLNAIGSANRVAYLRSFKQFLYKLQEEAPWYFQKITGADALYKIDPNVNTKKDAVLNFECLETVDMRISMLADLYRSAAFDFEHHREVLPYNLRTFKMRIHVFEMRTFNTSSGAIASLITGQSNQQYNDLLSCAVNGNLNVNFSSIPGQSTASNNSTNSLKSAFDAISIQTYELGMCEFDFYSQAPNFLEELSVADVPQASYKFGVKFGTVRKTGKYSFYQYLTDYVVKNSGFPISNTSPFGTNAFNLGNVGVSNPFYDPNEPTGQAKDYNVAYSPTSPNIPNPDTNSLDQQDADSNKMYDASMLRNVDNEFGNPKAVILHGVAGKVLGAAESLLANAVSKISTRVNEVLLGNVYSKIPSPVRAAQALDSFLSTGQLPKFGSGAAAPPPYNPGNVNFAPLNVPKDITQDPMAPLSTNDTISGSGFNPLPVDNQLSSKSEQFTKPNTVSQVSPKNIFRNK